MDAIKTVLGFIPGCVLITGGCAAYLYARFKYEPPASQFKDFVGLEQHLLQCEKHRDNVIVEGTVARLAKNSVWSEKAGIEGVARKVMSSTRGKTSTVSNISVPFLLVDSNGHSIKVTSVHHALRINRVMEVVWEEPNNQRNVPTTRELMLSFEISLSLFGCVSVNENEEMTLDNPTEADKSLTETVASRKLSRGLLYAGSFYLVLSGCGLIISQLY